MSTTTLSPEITRFAAAVRYALADLPPEEVDDLTDGLEADLAERQEESADAALGDPAAYADELRSAAGLPPRSAPPAAPRRSAWAAIGELPGRIAGDWRAMTVRFPLLGRVGAFLIAVRPVWWLLRGWALWITVMTLVNNRATVAFDGGPSYADSRFFLSPVPVVVLLACVVLSVQWGRGRWMPWRWVRAVVLVGSAVIAIALPFLLAWGVAQVNASVYTADALAAAESRPADGLRQGDHQVTNVFAYDAAGNPVDRVRLYDQNGRQIAVNGSSQESYWELPDGTGALVPGAGSPKGSGWNIFPLQRVSERDVQYGDLAKDATRRDADSPYVVVPPLKKAVDMTPSNVPTPGATPAPSDSVTSGATAEPTAGPTGSPVPTGTPSPSTGG
jgi:hypothetical protein